MKLFIGCDHGGFHLKHQLLRILAALKKSNSLSEFTSLSESNFSSLRLTDLQFLFLKKVDLQDLGCYDAQSVNYPDFAEKVCRAVLDLNFPETTNSDSSSTDALEFPSLGLLVCGTGQGMSMKANKYRQIRAALVWSEEIATLSREHNNANILCLPGRFISEPTAFNCLTLFLTTAFAKGRHLERVAKINNA